MSDVLEPSCSLPLSGDHQVLVDALLAHCCDVIALLEPDTTIRYVNPVVEPMLGFTVGELLGSKAINLVHPDDRPRVTERLLLLPEEFDAAEGIVLQLRQADGEWRHVEARANHRVGHPLVQGIIVTVRDLSERRSRTEALRQQRDLFDAVIDHAGALVMVVDRNGIIVRFNRACEEVTGTPADLVVGRKWNALMKAQEAERLRQVLSSLGKTQQCIETTVKWQTASDDEVIIDWHARAIMDEHGRLSFIVATGQDTTMQRREVEWLRRRALHDPLTGLPNRTLFVDRLETALRRVARAAQTVSVLFCDLDHFKVVNDTFGHAVGDAALIEVARRLEQACRAEDTVARIGGDEFVVLLEGIDDDEGLARLVDRVRNAFHHPMEAGGVDVNLSVSVGVASTTARLTPEEDGDELLRRADRAMYADKRVHSRRVPA